MSRHRQLSEEERALWGSFVQSITPLRRPPKTATAAAAREKTQPPSAVPPPPPRSESRRQASSPADTPPLAPLERRVKQRVARGRASIDARIDLHGFTQREAHAALLHFLERAQTDGFRIVLVVTGKGAGRAPRDPASERGVLRRQVPFWLELPEFRRLVVSFDKAHLGHGGEGALYVRLRRRR